ncbi:MAG TPA: hypothetical protein VF627_00840 [Abditibacterium sp.]
MKNWLRLPRGARWFVALWLAILVFPLSRQRAGEAWHWEEVGRLASPRAPVSDAPPLEADALAARAGNDPHLLAQAIDARFRVQALESYGGNQAQFEARLRAHRELLARFPREDWLRARVLQFFLIGPLDFDAASLQSRHLYSAKMNAARRREVEIALQIARDGARISPQNAYFSAMQAVYAFALRRNDEGFAALHVAARAPFYEEFTATLLRDHLRAAALEKPLSWEETIRIADSQMLPFGSGVYLFMATRAATGQSLEWWRRGDKARAVITWDDISRVTTLLRGDLFSIQAARSGRRANPWQRRTTSFQARHTQAWLWQNVGQALAPESLSVVTRGTYASYESREIVASQTFAALCRSAGRPDVADRATRAAVEFKADSDARRNLPGFSAAENFGAGGFPGLLLVAARFAGGALERLALVGAILWSLCWLISRPATTARVRRLDLFLAFLFCFCATAGTFFLVAGLSERPDFWSWFLGGASRTPRPQPFSAPLFLVSAPWFLLVFPALLFAARGARNADAELESQPKSADKWLFRLWMAVGAWFVLLVALPPSTWKSVFGEKVWAICIFLVLLSGAIAASLARSRAELKPKLALLGCGIVFSYVTLVPATMLSVRPAPWIWLWLVLMIVVDVACIGGALRSMTRERTWPQIRFESLRPRGFLTHYGALCGTVAIRATWLFVLITLIQWPIRVGVENDLQEFLGAKVSNAR